jgi:intracellular sulfur oxidation DsrE/DsrF family protein
MLRKLLILVLVTVVFWLAVHLLLNEKRQQAEQAGAPQTQLEPIVPGTVDKPSYRVADISVHSQEELMILFDRVEESLERPRTGDETALLNLVLHGPEVEFFAVRNYARYKTVVDRAAKLAALGAVDISICQTQMRSLGIGTDEVPSFLRQVPFGPDEVERLIDNGYVYM